MLNWFKSNHQVITAIGAMTVGLAALFVAWDQARVMRAQQHGAAYPAVQVDGYFTQTSTREAVGMRVSNSGVGPARIEDVSFLRDGSPSQDLSPIFAVLPETTDLSWTTMIGRMVAAGGQVEPMEFAWSQGSADTEEIDALQAEWRRWDVRICYCSVFDRCWIADTSGTGRRPERVQHCPRPDDDIFEIMGALDLSPEATESDEVTSP